MNENMSTPTAFIGMPSSFQVKSFSDVYKLGFNERQIDGILSLFMLSNSDPIKETLGLNLLNEMTKFRNLLSTIRMACGYIGNGSSTTVKIFQDDATDTWVMYSGTKLSVSSDRGFEGVIEEFAKTYKEDEHGELVKIVN